MGYDVKRPVFRNKRYNILDFGAKCDPLYNNKDAIQKAIDLCSENGGGIVEIPDGYFLTGPIELKSYVNLHVGRNAILQFTKSKEEYPLIWTEYEGIKRIRAISPISAHNCVNIAITGHGIIDGAGDKWRGIKKWKLTEKQWDQRLQISPYVLDNNKETKIWCPTQTYYEGVLKGEPDYNDPNALEIAAENWDVYRPVMVSLVNCDTVFISDVTLQNSPAWNIHPLYCKNFTLLKANVKNPPYAQNGDGIDLESCEYCEIANTNFAVGDDGICIKSGKNAEARRIKKPTRYVWIHDCKVFDAHGGFVVGSEMSRGVSDIIVENCVFSGTDIGIRFKSAKERGGIVENITMKNIVMSNIKEEAIIYTMGYKLINIEDAKEGNITTNTEDLPEFRNIIMDNIICDNSKCPLKINGLPELPIHDITLSNSYIAAKENISLSFCEKINLVDTMIKVNEEAKYYKNEVLEVSVK